MMVNVCTVEVYRSFVYRNVVIKTKVVTKTSLRLLYKFPNSSYHLKNNSFFIFIYFIVIVVLVVLLKMSPLCKCTLPNVSFFHTFSVGSYAPGIEC